MAFIYAIGDASGAHFNPAVSLGFTLKRVFPARWLVPYWVAQLVGAALAGLGLRVLFADAALAGVSVPHIPAATALVVEAVLSWLLVTVILGTADRYRVVGANAAVAVGATIALCGLVALPLTGASMNPARSFGPAFAMGQLGDLWIYVAGPAIGTCVAVLFTRFLYGPRQGDPGAEKAAQGER